MEQAASAAIVRLAVVGDAAELSRLFTQLAHPASASDLVARWGPWSAAGNSALVAARADGTLAGVAVLHTMWVLHRAQPLGRITALVVDEAARWWRRPRRSSPRPAAACSRSPATSRS
jgi:hypothetical protein